MRAVIDSYHARKRCPVFNQSDHQRFLEESYPTFFTDDWEKVRSDVKADGYELFIGDFEARFGFQPIGDRYKPEDVGKLTA